jgi:hypothetical protein
MQLTMQLIQEASKKIVHSIRSLCEWTARASSDRGDVPGWVLVTVMTAGLVVALWSVADGQLRTILGNALQSVSQP